MNSGKSVNIKTIILDILDMSDEKSRTFERINEIIRDIFCIASDRENWYKDSKINERIGWLKRYE